MKLQNFSPLFLLFMLSAYCIIIPQKLIGKTDDVLVLKAIKAQYKPDLASLSYSLMSTKDGRFWDNVHPKISGIPDSLENVREYYQWINNEQALYQAYKAGKVSQKDYDFYIKAWKSDITDCTPENVKTYVVIITGVSKSGRKYYLVDTDNDYDVGDEIPKVLENGNSRNFLTNSVVYEKFKEGRIQKDSTWVAFFEGKVFPSDKVERLWLRFNEYTSATFSLNSTSCRIIAYPGGAGAEYGKGTVFEIAENGKNVQKGEIGELIKLNDSFYSFDCSKDGLNITLTKANPDKGSTQVEMAPIPFEAKTLKGDVVRFPDDFKGKYVLLDFWAISCGPCIYEMRNYYIDIYKKYGGKEFEIIGIANNPAHVLKGFVKKNNFNWMIIPDVDTKNIQKKYQIYAYPTLFLIDPHGKIISKGQDLRSGKFENILKKNIKEKDMVSQSAVKK